MFTVLLVVILTVPISGDDKMVIHSEPMATMMECVAAVREMTYRAPNELKNGGRLQVGCIIKVPRSENP